MPKTFIIGDVHGCIDELNELMQQISSDADDHLIFIGDLVGSMSFNFQSN